MSESRGPSEPRSQSWLQGLPHEAARAVEQISVSRLVPEGQTLFDEGEEGTRVYLLRSGVVELSRRVSSGERAVIGMIHAGQMFGEVVLFEAPRYPVRATTLQESVVSYFSRDRFLGLLDDPLFRNPFISVLMRKQRYLTERVRLLSCCSVEERLMLFLNAQFPGRTAIDSPPTKREVAAAIGVTPETLSRVLKRMREAGTLFWEGKEIRVG